MLSINSMQTIQPKATFFSCKQTTDNLQNLSVNIQISKTENCHMNRMEIRPIHSIIKYILYAIIMNILFLIIL